MCLYIDFLEGYFEDCLLRQLQMAHSLKMLISTLYLDGIK